MTRRPADVVIAVRGGPTAKSRCASILDADTRAGLVRAMLQNTLEVVARTRGVGHIHVVTPTRALAAQARAFGAQAIFEAEPDGPTGAFELARRRPRAVDPHVTLVLLPADLPLLRPADLSQAIALASPDAVVLCPTLGDGGTAALILRAGADVALCYGEDSFARHVAAVRKARLRPFILKTPGLTFDLDTPKDIAALLARKDGGPVADFLREGRLEGRLEKRLAGRLGGLAA